MEIVSTHPLAILSKATLIYHPAIAVVCLLVLLAHCLTVADNRFIVTAISSEAEWFLEVYTASHVNMDRLSDEYVNVSGSRTCISRTPSPAKRVTVPGKAFAIIVGGVLFKASPSGRKPLISRAGKFSLSELSGGSGQSNMLDLRAERKLYPHGRDSFQIASSPSDWPAERNLLDSEFHGLIFAGHYGQLSWDDDDLEAIETTPMDVVSDFMTGMQVVADGGDFKLVTRSLRPNLDRVLSQLGLQASLTGSDEATVLPQWATFLTSYHVQRVLVFLRDKNHQVWLETREDASLSEDYELIIVFGALLRDHIPRNPEHERFRAIISSFQQKPLTEEDEKRIVEMLARNRSPSTMTGFRFSDRTIYSFSCLTRLKVLLRLTSEADVVRLSLGEPIHPDRVQAVQKKGNLVLRTLAAVKRGEAVSDFVGLISDKVIDQTSFPFLFKGNKFWLSQSKHGNLSRYVKCGSQNGNSVLKATNASGLPVVRIVASCDLKEYEEVILCDLEVQSQVTFDLHSTDQDTLSFAGLSLEDSKKRTLNGLAKPKTTVSPQVGSISSSSAELSTSPPAPRLFASAINQNSTSSSVSPQGAHSSLVCSSSIVSSSKSVRVLPVRWLLLLLPRIAFADR